VLPILKAAQADRYDRSRLLRQAGVVVRGEDPAACEERVTLAQYLRLWEEALSATPPGFPLRAPAPMTTGPSAATSAAGWSGRRRGTRSWSNAPQGLLGQAPAEEPISDSVRRAIVATLPSGPPSLPDVARSLGLSERTLRRRLADERTSFQELLEGCCSSLAGRYLERKDLALAEIAFLLGFSEPSPFYRAFRRWFGQAPESYRQGLGMQ